MTPQEIEERSFAIIDQEAGTHDHSSRHWAIVRRLIHTSADFDYQTQTRIHPEAVDAGIRVISTGGIIYSDTQMALAGIKKPELAQFGIQAHCMIADEAVARLAVDKGITRARAAVDAVVDKLENAIYVVGNAPTALFRLIDHVRIGLARPALIVGLPVGFVNAAESKAALLKMEIPYITNVGRKGGSNVAAAVINALLLMAIESD